MSTATARIGYAAVSVLACINSPAWVFSRGLVEKNGGFVPLRYSPETLRDYVRAHTSAGRMVTFNVLIDLSGKINPAIPGIRLECTSL